MAELKRKNEELTTEAQAFEAIKVDFTTRVVKLEEQLKAAQEKAVEEFRARVAFQDEVGKAYMEGFVDAKVTAKKLFPLSEPFCLEACG